MQAWHTKTGIKVKVEPNKRYFVDNTGEVIVTDIKHPGYIAAVKVKTADKAKKIRAVKQAAKKSVRKSLADRKVELMEKFVAQLEG